MSDIYEYPGDSAILDNGNLLVNPDFRINQRNIKDITITTYPLRDIADVWKIDNAPMGKCRAVQNHPSCLHMNCILLFPAMQAHPWPLSEVPHEDL